MTYILLMCVSKPNTAKKKKQKREKKKKQRSVQ